jgi:hypothetical protein
VAKQLDASESWISTDVALIGETIGHDGRSPSHAGAISKSDQ